MKDINLIPIEECKNRKLDQYFFKMIAIEAIIFLLLILFVQSISWIKSTFLAKNADLHLSLQDPAYQETEAFLQRYEQSKKALEFAALHIDGFGKEISINVVETAVNLMPATMYCTEVSLDSAQEIILIKGSGSNILELSKYIEILNQLGSFQYILPVEIESKGSSLHSFTLELKVL